MSFKRARVASPVAGPSQPIVAVSRRKVRKASVIVAESVTSNITVGSGSAVASTVLFRCGEVVSTSGAPQSTFVNEACTMVRFIFNGGIMCSNAVAVTNSIGCVFMVVARIEAGSNLVTRLRVADNDILTTAFTDSENIFFSGCWPYQAPQTTSQARTIMPIKIDMKAKRKLNTGDSIIMFTYTGTFTGTANIDVLTCGVSTVIAI